MLEVMQPLSQQARPRRTQAERRAHSRAALLEAAIECLARQGYAGTTIGQVVAAAGLSNGAMWRHFRSKADLMAAAVLQAEESLLLGEVEAASAHATTAERIDAAITFLWDHARRPSFQALLEHIRASRADDALREAMSASDPSAAAMFFDAFARVAGAEVAADPEFERKVRTIGLALYGAALTDGLRAPHASSRVLEEMKQLARELFVS